jgi:putative ABC transport system permease protein
VQLLPALAAVGLGIPAGLLLYELAGGDLSTAAPPAWWLLCVIPATLIVVAVLTAIPAEISARPIAETLRID